MSKIFKKTSKHGPYSVILQVNFNAVHFRPLIGFSLFTFTLGLENFANFFANPSIAGLNGSSNEI